MSCPGWLRRAPLFLAFAALAVCSFAPPSLADRPTFGFTIGGWLIGDPSIDHKYSDIRDAGFDVLFATDANTDALATTVAQKLHLLAPRSDGSKLLGFLSTENPNAGYDGCPNVTNNLDPSNCALDNEHGYIHMMGYGDQNSPFSVPEVRGWLVRDEPKSQDGFSRLLTETDIIDAHFSTSVIPYVNLLPISGMSSLIDVCVPDALPIDGTPPPANDHNKSRYTCYVESYLSHFNGVNTTYPPPILSDDHYPFQIMTDPYCETASHPDPYDDIFLNLTVLRDEAALHSTASRRLPFWQVIQLSQFNNSPCTMQPGLHQITFHAMAALAYGATGVSYWTLCPSPATDGYGDGIFRADGSKVVGRYAMVTTLNRTLHQLGGVLINATPIDVYHQSEMGQVGIAQQLMANGSHPSGLVSSISSIPQYGGDNALDAMVSVFQVPNNSNMYYLLVMNKNLLDVRNVTVTLSSGWEHAYKKLKTGPGDSEIALSGYNTFTISQLQPGDAELITVLRSSGGGGGNCGGANCEEIEPGRALTTWSISPMPARSFTTVSYTLAKQAHVNLTVYDIAGRQVASPLNDDISAGNHSFRWDISKLQAGTYFSRLRVDGETLNRKLLIVN
jgi:hypothetical protein